MSWGARDNMRKRLSHAEFLATTLLPSTERRRVNKLIQLIIICGFLSAMSVMGQKPTLKTNIIFTNPKDKRTEDYVTGRFG